MSLSEWREKVGLFFVVLTGVFLRFIPYQGFSLPLGYDPGFYRFYLDLYIQGAPKIVEYGIPEWLRSMHPQGMFLLGLELNQLAGLSSLQIEMLFFPILCSLVAVFVFVTVREFFDSRAGLMAAFLSVVSFAQFKMFEMMYFKNVFGLIFLVLAIYLLNKKRYIALSLIYAGLGIYHRPEFLIFSLFLIPYFLKERDFRLLTMTGITALLIMPFWLPRWEIYVDMVLGVFSTAVDFSATGGGGTFFGLQRYLEVSAGYIPFSIYGLTKLIKDRDFNPVVLITLITGSIVVFELFFFKRLLIVLDLFLVMLAGYGALKVSERFDNLRSGFILVAVFLVTSVLTLGFAIDAEPKITPGALDEVKNLTKTEPDAHIMTTSRSAPWVLAWSNRTTIAPGLFDWSIHDKDEWKSFFATSNLTETREFLDEYPEPLYLFDYQGWGGRERFSSECFTSRGNYTVKYVC